MVSSCYTVFSVKLSSTVAYTLQASGAAELLNQSVVEKLFASLR